MVAIMNQYQRCSLISCAKNVIDASGNVLTTAGQACREGIQSSKGIIERCFSSYRNLIGEPVAVMFRKQSEDLFFDTKYYSLGDLDFWFRVLEYGDYYCLGEPLVSFRQHKSSTTYELLCNFNWVLDFMRFGHTHKALLQTIGKSEDEYLMGAVQTISLFVDELTKNGEVSIQKLNGFKEVAYYCLRTLGAIERERNYYKAKCEGITTSASWRMTRPLRVFKARLHGQPASIVSD
jgi:hypothetical protein